jgi:aspartate/methionine/tyrosine aminotransferase
MRLPDFKLERFFARWEFEVPHLLCASDAETWSVAELLEMCDEESKALWEGLELGYTQSAGHPLLRSEIARLYGSVGAEDVLVYSGAQEAIFSLMNVLIEKGDHAVVVWPAYQSLYEVARAAGGAVTLVPLRPDEGWALDPGVVQDAVTMSTKAIVVNYPHSPTGSMIGREDFTRLVAIAEETGSHLFCDEVYRFMEVDLASRLPAGADASTRGISLGVMSKSLGLAGLRIGWLVSRDHSLMDRLARFKDYTTICNSAPSEILAIAALRCRDRLLRRNRQIMADNLAALDDFFERNHEIVEWVRPASGTVAFPRLKAAGDVDRFAEELARRAGVLILPGTSFDYPEPHFRIGFGRRDLPVGLARLEAFLAGRETIDR